MARIDSKLMHGNIFSYASHCYRYNVIRMGIVFIQLLLEFYHIPYMSFKTYTLRQINKIIMLFYKLKILCSCKDRCALIMAFDNKYSIIFRTYC